MWNSLIFYHWYLIPYSVSVSVSVSVPIIPFPDSGFHVLLLPQILALTRYGFWRERVKKSLINHKMMPTGKHIDITPVLRSNMNSNLTTFIFGCLKKLARTIVQSKENCLGVIVSVSNQFLIQKNLRDIPGSNQGRYKAYSPTHATLGELTFLHLRLTGPLCIDGRVILLTGPNFLHINTSVRPACSTR